jgi:MFS family permease
MVGASEQSSKVSQSAPTGSLGRRFVFLWGATGSSNLADGILAVGVPLLAVTLTRSPMQISLISALVWLPWLLVSLPAGVAADRYDRRQIMVIATLARVALLGVVTVIAASDALSMPVLYLTVLIAGTAAVFSDTSAQSLLPMVVHRDQLSKANGRLVSVQTIANSFLGAPIAGFVVGVAAALVFGLVGACFVVAALLLWRVRGDFAVERQEHRPMREDIATGLRYLWGHRLLRSMACSLGLLNLGSNAYAAVLVLWVVGPESRIGMPEAGYGFAIGAIGVGAIAGSLLVERVAPRIGSARTLSIALLMMSVVLSLPILFPHPAVLIAAMIPFGLGSGTVNVVFVATRQRIVPADMLGRTNASFRMVGLGVIPLGALFGGFVGETIGLSAALFSGVIICLVAWMVVARYVTQSAMTAAERAE